MFVSLHTSSSKSLIARVSIYSYTLLHSTHCSLHQVCCNTRRGWPTHATPNIINIKIMEFLVPCHIFLVCVMFFCDRFASRRAISRTSNTSNWFNIAFLIIHKSPRYRFKGTTPSPSCGWSLGMRLPPWLLYSILYMCHLFNISTHFMLTSALLFTYLIIPIAILHAVLSYSFLLPHRKLRETSQFSLLCKYMQHVSGKLPISG